MATVQNFRDCKAWIGENLAMTTTSNEAVKLYDHALHQLITHVPDATIGGVMGAIDKALEADAEFVMGKVISLGLTSMGTSCRLSDHVKKAADELEQLRHNKNLNERERLHCAAVVEYSNENNFKACQLWEEILFSYPRDTLALQLAYSGHLTLGNSSMLRDCVARILPYWKKTDPYYGYLLNLYAFGLEETNLFDSAQKTVTEGLLLAPEDAWGIHTSAHVYESTCKYKEGTEFLSKTESIWGDNNTLACHMYWHLSIYYIEHEEYAKALEVFDQHIAPKFKKSHVFFNINDGCQLLQRLEFEGVDVEDRWDDVYECYKSHVHQQFYCYNDVHILLSFVRSKTAIENNSEKKFMYSVEKYIKEALGDNSTLTREVGLGMFNSVIAYSEERYDDAVELLYPLKRYVVRIGGSHAQRDIFEQLLLNACIRSKLRKHHDLGRGLLYERRLLKPESPLTDRMLERLLALHF